MMKLKLVKEETNINFMGIHKFAFVLSTLMIVLSIVMIFTRGFNMGIDFTGGLLMEIKTPENIKIGEIREALSHLSAGTPTIQEFGDNALMIKVPGKEAGQEAQKRLYQEVNKALGSDVDFRRVEYVGPQVGHELIIIGLKAFIYSLLGILAYLWFRFEWQFGITGIIALTHDVCATILFFTITQIEFDLSTVAAVLLVAGYSINDTVVVFDRVREALRKYRKKPLGDLLNLSINQTLSRTVMTSFTTILALISLLIFGAEVIKGFTYIMLVGIIVGTYSSIFIASPILIYMNLRRDSI